MSMETNMTVWKNILDRMFSMDKLEALSKQNVPCALAYFQLITGLNGVILTTQPNLLYAQWDIFKAFPTAVQEATLEGKLDAVAAVFTHVSQNIDEYFTTSAIANLISVGDVMELVGKVVKVTKGP